MKSFRCAHIVVVVGTDHGQVLAARLRRMHVAQVSAVAGLEEARRLCQTGVVDACLVATDDADPDAFPEAKSDAPGRDFGVPTLMVTATVTPHVRLAARRHGYLAAVPAAIAPRMLHRRIRAALQRRRAACRGPQRPARTMPLSGFARPIASGNPTLH